MFKFITSLCDSCDWDETANIGAKYLRVVRPIIMMELDEGNENDKRLLHYELVASAIDTILAKIYDKIKRDI